MPLEEEVLHFARRTVKKYYEEDNRAFLSVLADGASVIGTGKHEICTGREAARKMYAREAEQANAAFRVTQDTLCAKQLTETIFLVYGTVCAAAKQESLADLNLRVTMIVCKSKEQMHILHLHVSNPDPDQGDGEFFVRKEQAFSRDVLRQQVRSANDRLQYSKRLLAALVDNVPGGILVCHNDSRYTIRDMSQGFLKLTGYTKEEIHTRFGDKYMNMIHPDDRPYATEATIWAGREGSAELAYRICCADGSVHWLMDQRKMLPSETGESLFFCVLIDTTEQKRESEQLRLSLERYQLLFDQTADIVFEWNFSTDVVQFSPNWERKFGYSPVRHNLMKALTKNNYISQHDCRLLQECMRQVRAGSPLIEQEVRIKDRKGSRLWCRVRAATQYDRDQKPICAMGVIVDISEDKRQRMQLQEQAQCDSMTGLLNKMATEEHVTNQISQAGEQSCAMMIFDLDDFKSINDCFGHMCGDAVLTETAAAIRQLFRSSDVTGRIGGDEFLAFVQDIDRSAALKKAHMLIHALENIRLNDGTRHVTCSVGISFYPQDARSFSDLYRFADRALYQVKENGRANAAVYEDYSPPVRLQGVGGYRRLAHHGDVYDAGGQLFQECFQVLSSSLSVKTALQRVMAYMGRWFGAGRIALYMKDVPQLSQSWCDPQLRCELQLPAGWFLQENEADCFCNSLGTLPSNQTDLLRRSGVTGLLACSLVFDGRCIGALELESFHEHLRWTVEQENTFRQISALLSLALPRYTAQQTL